MEALSDASTRLPDAARRCGPGGTTPVGPAPDELPAADAPALIALRWAALVLGLVLGLAGGGGGSVAAGGTVLLASTWWRRQHPVGHGRTGWHRGAALLLEVAVAVAVVEATGFATSPFLASLAVATLVAGFAGGLRVVSVLAGVVAGSVVLPSLVLASQRAEADLAVQFAVEVVLVGVVGGCCRTFVDMTGARWHERVRAGGAEHERARLARELHDHVGQALVHVGFQLDRLATLHGGTELEGDLRALRTDVGEVVGELRAMLVELRCDVSETRGVDQVLATFLHRVNDRRRVSASLDADADTRMPLAVEREFWRVAREAVMNAELHGEASTVSVRWRCNARGALLEVTDDGVGMALEPERPASGFGMLGMRERAEAVGARLDVVSGPEHGTVVRMSLEAA